MTERLETIATEIATATEDGPRIVTEALQAYTHWIHVHADYSALEPAPDYPTDEARKARYEASRMAVTDLAGPGKTAELYTALVLARMQDVVRLGAGLSAVAWANDALNW